MLITYKPGFRAWAQIKPVNAIKWKLTFFQCHVLDRIVKKSGFEYILSFWFLSFLMKYWYYIASNKLKKIAKSLKKVGTYIKKKYWDFCWPLCKSHLHNKMDCKEERGGGAHWFENKKMFVKLEATN